MVAVWYRARAELRRTVTASIVLTVVVAVIGGVVIAAVAGALRGRDALPSFLEYNNASDISVFSSFGSLSPDEERRLVDEMVARPEWEVVGAGRPVVLSLRVDGEWIATFANGVIEGPYLTELARPILIDGRLPDFDREEEVVINEALADAAGLEAGDTLDLRTISPELLDAVTARQTSVDPDGELVTVTVTGIVRSPVDLSLDRSAQERLGSDSWFLALGPAFLERFEGRLATFGVGVSIEQGNLASEIVASATRAIDFETKALMAFALVLLITSASLIGQALGRQAAIDLDDDESLASLGMRRRERAAVPLARGTIVALAGSLGAASLALALSGLFPVGVARRAELDPGIDADLRVLGLGAALIAVGVLARVGVTGWRRTAPSPSVGGIATERVWTTSRVATVLHAPVSAEAGVRMALQRGRGRTAVPVAGAIVAVTTSVLVLTATLLMGSSLGHLIATPALQGWPWDLAVGNLNDLENVADTVDSLRANDRVDGFIGFSSGTIVIDGHDSYAAAFGRGDPSVRPPAIEGRLPRAEDEVALGIQTLGTLGKDIGDTVVLAAAPGAPEVEAQIVGTVVLPAGLDTQLTLGRGAVMTGRGLTSVYGPDEQWVPNTFLLNLTPGTSPRAGARSVIDDLGDSTRFNFAPDIENLRRVQHLPLLLAVMVGLLGIGTLVNVLVTSVRRHRRDLATFATLGFRRRQLGGAVAWQATTIALVALVVGMPLGLAVGRTIWRLVMDSIGLQIGPSVPTGLLAVVALVTVLAANLIAGLPARSAARTHPAEAFRSE